MALPAAEPTPVAPPGAGPATGASRSLATAEPSAWGDRLPAGSLPVPVERAVPVRVRIPALGVDAAVVPVGVRADGALDLPADPSTVAWFAGGAAPGESGSSVLAAHVDQNGAEGVFFRLEELPAGSAVIVDRSDGTSASVWTQGPAQRIAKTSLPLDDVFRRGAEPVLTLITCGGEFDPRARSYRDNVVVRATGAAR
jgi:sortase (surface protein transpeptidase)